MSKEIMFGSTGINEVAAPQEGMKIAQRQADNINSKSGKKANIFQAAQVVAGGLKVGADAINESNRLAAKKKIEDDSIETTKAKTDYLTMIMSPSYRDASSANRAEMFENSYKNMAGASPAYTEAFTNYSSGQYISEYDKRGEEEDNAAYNNIGSLYKSVEGKMTPDALIDTYHSANPRLDKTVMGTAILSEMYGEMSFNIGAANNETELQAALVTNEEMKGPFKTPLFLTTKSKQGLEGIAKLEKGLSAVLKDKRDSFKASANTRIDLNNDKDNPIPTKRYVERPVYADYVIGKEDKAIQMYNDDMHKYNVMEEARQKSYVYDPDVHTDWSKESTETKEVYQEALDYRIQSQLENGNLTDASNTITSNGSIDIKRLNNVKQSIKAGLNSENAGQVHGQLMRMSAKNGAALNVLFPDSRERAKIIALGPLNQIRGESLEETWKYIQSSPELMPDKSKTRAEIKELSTLVHKTDTPTEMKTELQSMYNTLQSYGIEHSDIMDGLNKYIDSKPYEVNLKSYTENEQDIMKYAIGAFKKNEDSTMYEDPLTGMLFEQDIYGNKTNLIDKKGLYNYANKMAVIKQYNRDHATSQFIEKQAGRFAETVGDIVSAEAESLGNYKDSLVNAGSYVNYLYMTKLTKDGHIVDRPKWEAPNPLNPTPKVVRDSRDPWETQQSKDERKYTPKGLL